MPDSLVGDGRVNDCIGDRPVPHEGLQRPGINPAPRQGIPGRVPEHVGMDEEWQPGGLPKPLNELLGAVNRQGCLTLAEEQKAAVLAIFADQLPDQAKLVFLQPVDARRAVP
jgi:hypothetical protein